MSYSRITYLQQEIKIAQAENDLIGVLDNSYSTLEAAKSLKSQLQKNIMERKEAVYTFLNEMNINTQAENFVIEYNGLSPIG
ncbi:MAG: hypothetical protein SFW66_10150 [Gammaproteobacteria bacterium]|nr:hypothetical protein [Gammaproteobacteria bacterium]